MNHLCCFGPKHVINEPARFPVPKHTSSQMPSVNIHLVLALTCSDASLGTSRCGFGADTVLSRAC